MEGLKRGSIGLAAVAALMFVAAMLPEAAASRITVGGGSGWSPNVNYTNWTDDKHFYNGDWLFFVFDRNQYDVVEVNATDFANCTTGHPLHNWTRGSGRDVVPLNVTKTYYFTTTKGACYGGMKVAIHVENPSPPPSASPARSGSPASLMSNFRAQVFIPALFAVGAVWDSLLLLL